MKERTSSIPDPSLHGGLKADNTTVKRKKRVCVIYLLVSFNQLKFMRLCFIHIFRYSYCHEEAGPISDTSEKIIIMKITIITETENNDDQLW